MKTVWMLLLCAVLLVSCAPALEESTAPADPLPPFGGEEGTLGLVVDGVCRYTVIRSESASDAVIAAARSLDTYLFHHLKTHIDVKNDFAAPRPLEILVGVTNREESQSVLCTLKEEEYTVRRVGDKLVLCGHTDEGTLKAVEWFLKNCVKNRDLKEDEVPQLIWQSEGITASLGQSASRKG